MTDDDITVYTDEETKACQQHVFNTAVSALRAQNRASKSMDGPCNYRSPDGSKCVIGHLIPDELYKPSIEGHAVDTIHELYKFIPDYAGCSIELLKQLQRVHDKWYDCGHEYFNQALHQIAEYYELDTTVLNDLT